MVLWNCWLYSSSYAYVEEIYDYVSLSARTFMGFGGVVCVIECVGVYNYNVA